MISAPRFVLVCNLQITPMAFLSHCPCFSVCSIPFHYGSGLHPQIVTGYLQGQGTSLKSQMQLSSPSWIHHWHWLCRWDLLLSLERAANCVGLYLNESKTEYMINSAKTYDTFEMKTINGYILKLVNDYKYLGSYISSSEKDFNTRKGMAWSACNDLHKIWVSDLNLNMKIDIFKTLIEPILLYGSETWTLSSKLQKRVDGTYTRLLMRIKNISWKRHPTKQQIYNNLPQVSQIIKRRRVQFAGHCFRASKEMASNFVLWKPNSTGRRNSCKLTYPDVISRDTGIDFNDLGSAMGDREVWGSLVKSITSTEVEKWWWWRGGIWSKIRFW